MSSFELNSDRCAHLELQVPGPLTASKTLQYIMECRKSEALVLLLINALYTGAVQLQITEWTFECVCVFNTTTVCVCVCVLNEQFPYLIKPQDSIHRGSGAADGRM